MNDDIKVTFDSTEDISTTLDVGSIQYGQLEIGTTTTGKTGEEARVTNSGSSSHAILNFTIPRGERGERGEKGVQGEKGKDGIDGIDGKDGIDGAIQYTAGTGIEITNDNIINNTQTSAEWGKINGTLSDQTDMMDYFSSKEYVEEKTVTKADNISCSNNQLQLKSGESPIGNAIELPNEVVISKTEPTNEDWKIWIDTDEVNNLGSEVVDTLDGNETNKAPSVNAVNNKFEKSILDAWRSDYTTKGTDYEKVNFNGINNKKGTAFTVSDGNIICNKDMLISIEGSYYWTGISSKRVGYRVAINGESRRVFNKFCDVGSYYDVSLDRVLYQVKQGDVISLYVRTEEGAGGSSGSRGNFILQEL